MKSRPHLHRSSLQPVYTEPCKFFCRLACLAGVRSKIEGDFGRERNARGAKEGGRETSSLFWSSRFEKTRRARWSRLIFQHACKAVLGNSGSSSAQRGIGKFCKQVVDWSALYILQNHFLLLATLREIECGIVGLEPTVLITETLRLNHHTV